MSANRQSAKVPDVMSAEEIAALKSAGYGVGDAGDFLGLSHEERELVNLNAAVTRTLCAARKRAGITQAELAKRIGSSQSRVAMIENGANGITLDLVFKALFAVGGTMPDVVRELSELKKREAELRHRLDAADRILKAGGKKKPVAVPIRSMVAPRPKPAVIVPYPKVKERKKEQHLPIRPLVAPKRNP
nr:helix-turn-helix domain protein [uncultured bacterium]